MKQKKLRIGLLAAGCIAVIALPVYALLASHWIHPCPGLKPLTCDNDPCLGRFLPLCCELNNCPPPNCWCEGDFDDDDNWTQGVPRDIDLALIRHSNDAVTNEQWLAMQFSDHTVFRMRIVTKDTGGDDELDIRFDNKNAGGDTMTVRYELELNATNGKVTLTAEDLATITTE